MLPYTGTYAQLGVAITNGFKLAVTESGGKLGGREPEYFTVDRRIRSGQGHRQHQQARDPGQGRRPGGHGSLRSRHGHGGKSRARPHLLIIPNAGRMRPPAPCARRIFSAPRSPTGSPPIRWARCSPTAASRKWSRSPGNTGAGEEAIKRFQGRLHQGGGNHREGTVLPFPQRRIPAAADRDCIAQARCRVRVLRRRRRGQADQGLGGSGPERARSGCTVRVFSPTAYSTQRATAARA